MTETYRVVIKGVKEGFTKEQVVRNLATLFQSTEKRIHAKFEAPAFLVKKGLDLQSTGKYISVVEKQGCVCAIESESDMPPPVTANENIIQNKEQVETVSSSNKHRNTVTQTSLNSAIPPEWYYELRSSRLGPVSKEDIRKLISDGKLALDSRVWKKGLDDWIEITSPIIWKA